jgi:hypothetical protein
MHDLVVLIRRRAKEEAEALQELPGLDRGVFRKFLDRGLSDRSIREMIAFVAGVYDGIGGPEDFSKDHVELVARMAVRGAERKARDAVLGGS